MADLEWNDFRIILAIGRAGSVAAAARFLGIDASTVSRRLAAAEKAIGAILVVRGNGEFSLTPEGRAAFSAGEAMEAAVDTAKASVRSARHELSGIVRIACPPVELNLLRNFPATVSRKHPDLKIELLSGRTPVDLAKGEADISIRATRPDDLDLAVAHAFVLGAGVYASVEYLASHGRPASHADVAGHDLVRYGAAFLHMPAFNWIEKFADPSQPAVRVDNVDSARSLLISGAGIGVLYCLAGDAEKQLERVFADPIDQIDMNIVYHQSMRGSARLRAVLDLLVALHRVEATKLSGRSR